MFFFFNSSKWAFPSLCKYYVNFLILTHMSAIPKSSIESILKPNILQNFELLFRILYFRQNFELFFPLGIFLDV